LVVRLWSQLFHDRTQLEIELDEDGTTPFWIAWDVRDVRELQERYGERLASMSREARLKLALDWFGDHGHPQPPLAERTPEHSLGYSPEFGWLHRLDDDESTRTEAPQEPHDEKAGGEIPTSLVEKAVREYEASGKKLGRRTLPRKVPALEEWGARLILGWYRVGKPAGLWLEDGRLRWGPAITPVPDGWEQREQKVSPTPRALRLPRI
jgi:hypothetical protein